MQRRRRQCVALLAVASLAVSGCQSDGKADVDDLGLDDVTGSQADEESSDVAEPEAELDEDPEFEVDGEPEYEVDPFAIPDEIDTEYVSRVVNELYRLSFETIQTTRDELAPGDTLPPHLFEELGDVHAGERLALTATDLQTAVDSELPPPDGDDGPLSWAAERVIVGSSECIVAVGALILPAEAASEESVRIPDYFFQMIRGESSDRNQTTWRIVLDGVDSDPRSGDYPGMCS